MQSTWFRLRGSHPLRPAFPGAFTYHSGLVTAREYCRLSNWVLQHPPHNAGRLSCVWVGLGFSRFVRHYYGNCFFSSGYLDVSVPPLASPPSGRVPLYREGVAPFGDLRIGQKATPRSLSQRIHVLLRPWLPRHPPYALYRLSQTPTFSYPRYFAPLLRTHSLCRYVSTSEEGKTSERRENSFKLQVQARSAFNIFDRVTQYEIEFPTIFAGFLSETNIVWLVSYSLQLFSY